MSVALISNAVHCESCAADFLAFADCLGSVDTAFGTYDPIVNEFSLIAAARIACTAYAITLTADQGALRVPKSTGRPCLALKSSNGAKLLTRKKELSGLVALDTWDLVPIASIPAAANIMHCHFVFAIKRKADGSIDKFKARLVADGNTQKHGVDFNRVFATVVKALTIRLVLAIAAARDYNLTSLDIRFAGDH